MDAEGRRAREQMKKLPLKDKLKNFWFYYKIHTAVAIFVILIFGTSIVQCINRVDYDLQVMYFSCNQISPERMAAIEELLKTHSVDVTGNDRVDTLVSPYVGDINAETQSSETMAILVKLQAEVVSNISPAFIMDQGFKNFAAYGYEGAFDKIIDLSLIPEMREKLKLQNGEKLYWVSLAKGGEYKEPADGKDAFVNAEIIENYLEQKME